MSGCERFTVIAANPVPVLELLSDAAGVIDGNSLERASAFECWETGKAKKTTSDHTVDPAADDGIVKSPALTPAVTVSGAPPSTGDVRTNYVPSPGPAIGILCSPAVIKFRKLLRDNGTDDAASSASSLSYRSSSWDGGSTASSEREPSPSPSLSPSKTESAMPPTNNSQRPEDQKPQQSSAFVSTSETSEGSHGPAHILIDLTVDDQSDGEDSGMSSEASEEPSEESDDARVSEARGCVNEGRRPSAPSIVSARTTKRRHTEAGATLSPRNDDEEPALKRRKIDITFDLEAVTVYATSASPKKKIHKCTWNSDTKSWQNTKREEIFLERWVNEVGFCKDGFSIKCEIRPSKSSCPLGKSVLIEWDPEEKAYEGENVSDGRERRTVRTTGVPAGGELVEVLQSSH
ncbi:hypothetical protein NKR23_g2111 [Pleurostoma richardsiae]|uniref:Uncharacterized protein n=1 Tax=Pleurostoma richardsiae TaxID=41990 RepID=A0AA38VNY1_9PEZI|nr:hypothetical protein NKR23_g2111 [Pleurostoma richardsiae]